MMDDEITQIERARQGDPDAFRQLVEAHSAELFRLAYRLLGETEAADDVVQEAFLKAYRSLPRFDGRSRFGTWLHRITVNCAMDHLRRRRREAERHSPDAMEELLERRESSSPGPDRVVWSGQVERQMARSLDRLSPLERTAFLLRHFEERSIGEISLVLGSGASATKHAIFRAVKKLRQDLAPWVEADHARTA